MTSPVIILTDDEWEIPAVRKQESTAENQAIIAVYHSHLYRESSMIATTNDGWIAVVGGICDASLFLVVFFSHSSIFSPT